MYQETADRACITTELTAYLEGSLEFEENGLAEEDLARLVAEPADLGLC